MPPNGVVKLKLSILLRVFYGYADDPTLLTRHGDTGHQGVSSFHHLRPIGPPLYPMAWVGQDATTCRDTAAPSGADMLVD
jgi:hypothetical protein